MAQSEYERLYNQYINKTNEELTAITKNENGYSEIAIKVANDILNSDSKESNNSNNQEEIEDISQEDVLISIKNDLHSIKNIMVFFVTLTIISLLLGVYMGIKLLNIF